MVIQGFPPFQLKFGTCLTEQNKKYLKQTTATKYDTTNSKQYVPFAQSKEELKDQADIMEAETAPQRRRYSNSGEQIWAIANNFLNRDVFFCGFDFFFNFTPSSKSKQFFSLQVNQKYHICHLFALVFRFKTIYRGTRQRLVICFGQLVLLAIVHRRFLILD